MAYLGSNATVQDLLNLANAVLGGALTPGIGGVPSYSDINSAVDAINEGFDECKDLVGYCTSPSVVSVNRLTNPEASANKLNVTAYPNPFNDVVTFTITSQEAGQAQLEVYNMLGQRVNVVYNGYVQANKAQVVTYRVGTKAQQNLMYVLKLGTQRATGKLLNVNQ